MDAETRRVKHEVERLIKLYGKEYVGKWLLPLLENKDKGD
jgi:hypothetical protein